MFRRGDVLGVDDGDRPVTPIVGVLVQDDGSVLFIEVFNRTGNLSNLYQIVIFPNVNQAASVLMQPEQPAVAGHVGCVPESILFLHDFCDFQATEI